MNASQKLFEGHSEEAQRLAAASHKELRAKQRREWKEKQPKPPEHGKTH